jgi:probable HAF family extracellular repeat protein
MHIRRFIGAAAAVACALALAIPLGADDKTMLIELDLRSGLLPSSVSATGTIVVGNLDFTGASAYWMPTSGTIYIGGLFGRGSRDGRTIVGSALDSRGIQQAAIWLRGTEWRLLGSFTPNAAPCDTSLSSGRGTSADGRVVVGFARNGCSIGHAFRWEEATGMVDLGSSVAAHDSYATGVSGDGKVVVGYQERTDSFLQGARWVDGRQELIPGAPGYPLRYVGTAYAANRDGSMVMGRICKPGAPLDQSAWLWTPGGGTECLPAPRLMQATTGPPIIVSALGASDDGRIVGGGQAQGSTTISEAVIWIDKSPAYLKDYLQANGVPDAFRTWINSGEITDVSPDGRILVGYGAALGGYRGYIVILGSSRVMP